MKQLTILLAIVATGLTATAPTTAADPQKPASVVSIKMPGDLAYDYKKGPGQQLAQTYCLTCHSSSYVSMQPPMDAAAWTKEVTKMRKAYGADIPDADASAIAAYLGKAYGPPLQ